MRYLLDTHAALWLFEGNDKLTIITIDENIKKYDVPWVW